MEFPAATRRTVTYAPLGRTNAPCCECGGTDVGERYMKTIVTVVGGRHETEKYPVDEQCKK